MTKISKKLIRNYKRLKLNKIINLSEAKLAKEKIAKIQAGLKKKLEIRTDPSFKLYTLLQNTMSYFAEEISVQDDFIEYYDQVVEVEDDYMPSFPPGSPLTGSYFTYWAFCDLQFGKHKETINTILSDIGEVFGFDEIVMKGLANLDKSCMRFYKHMGFEDDLILLKDLLTDKVYPTLCASGYRGKKDEIWYIRIVPNLDKIYDYSISLTTPYVIINYKEQAWLDFFQRQGIKKGEKDFEKKYSKFMKHPSDFKYWHDYIMDGYSNYKPNCIYLTGIPDIKGSKPHELGTDFNPF